MGTCCLTSRPVGAFLVKYEEILMSRNIFLQNGFSDKLRFIVTRDLATEESTRNSEHNTGMHSPRSAGIRDLKKISNLVILRVHIRSSAL